MNVKKNQRGFSMIEVLVAATIMTMIVMMLGMIFQQSSQAWSTGKHRADTYQQVRALFGAIQRDASMAIDQNSLPKNQVGAEGYFKDDQSFSGSSLKFYTLTGTGFNNDADPATGTPRRSITLVEYSGNGSRSVKTYVPVSGGGFANGAPQDFSILSPSQKGPSLKVTGFTAYDSKGASVGANVFPAYVAVSAGVQVDGVQSYDVGAASSGPDLTLGKGPGDIRGRDDIRTWVE
jgi:prepilin-type N-terminal cleavage/methylation domain-containing protein